jgi:hypothetical protein
MKLPFSAKNREIFFFFSFSKYSNYWQLLSFELYFKDLCFLKMERNSLNTERMLQLAY